MGEVYRVRDTQRHFLPGGDGLTPERWAELERLYHAALALDVAARAAFLRERCAGDVALQREVEILLAQRASFEGFLSPPALGVAAEVISHPGGARLIGRQLGVYQLQALLGVGGMAEVYRARDTTLGRDVAIKILPEAFTADPDRLARFAREARVLAALNHPNVATIHGIEQSDGVRGIVMELVEGETLAERIQRGKLPIPEALNSARQITEALDAAHEKGIVHRDLKPANIKLTAAGRRQGARLRSGESRPRRWRHVPGADRDERWHTRRDDSRHRGVHEPRTGARANRRQADRHLGVRMCGV